MIETHAKILKKYRERIEYFNIKNTKNNNDKSQLMLLFCVKKNYY